MASQTNTRNIPYVLNGTVNNTGAWIDVTFRPSGGGATGDGITWADSVLIRNHDGANALTVSFDGGTTFFTIPINTNPIAIDWRIKQIFLKAAAGTAAYQIICTAGKQFRPF